MRKRIFNGNTSIKYNRNVLLDYNAKAHKSKEITEFWFENRQLANAKIDEIRNGFSEWLEEQSDSFKERLTSRTRRAKMLPKKATKTFL